MRRDWDERARRNAFLYIASWRKDWNDATFFESGEQDYVQLVVPILEKLQFDPVQEIDGGARLRSWTNDA